MAILSVAVAGLLALRFLRTNIWEDIKSKPAHCTLPDDFMVKMAKTVDEVCKLVEAGFEYVTFLHFS